MKTRKVLYVGAGDGTSRHRANAIGRLGHKVRVLPYRYPQNIFEGQIHRVMHRFGLDFVRSNTLIQKAIREQCYDLLWIDKGLYLRPHLFHWVRKQCPRLKIVSYSPDDMFNPQNTTARYLNAIPLFDLHVTTKSYNVEELYEHGARDVFFVANAYAPEVHKPLRLSPSEHLEYDAEVGFIGSFESERAGFLRGLAEAGMQVTIRGAGWEAFCKKNKNLHLKKIVREIEYAKALNGIKINLNFLRKVNRDLQTTRSIEIPACGSFMLSERTEEHLELFEEGKEAEFFSSLDELREKCLYYLEHEEERISIAKAGRQRCMEGGYSNDSRMAEVFTYLFGEGGLS